MKLKIAAALALFAGAASADNLLVNGAGATFPAPLYTKWFAEYAKSPKTNGSTVQINYQAIGSGGGIKQITEKTVDFGASDAPMNDEELAKAPGMLHIPTVMGAVVVTWNDPELTALKLSPEVLAGIFLGEITTWNHPAIAKDNPGKLPTTAITVAHRSDGSGTTAVFTDYLAKVSPEWKQKVGAGKSVNWPVGLGAKGNDGVTGLVKSTKGAIGYVELAFANQNKLPTAQLKSNRGEWVTASLESITAAAGSVELPADYRVSITNAPGKGAWPVASFTYLLVRKEQEDVMKGPALTDFLWWAVHKEGQEMAAPLDYAPLPTSVVTRVEATLKTITVQGKLALGNGK
jgi:phosphate transport system substrate-binding protein